MHKSLLISTASALSAFASLVPFSAHAQSTATSATVQEVIVTARKQKETLLSVPVAVTAITSQAIQSRGIESLNDVANYTPGFSLTNAITQRNDRSSQTLFMRGMVPGSTSVAAGTSVFIDGAPVSAGFVEGIGDLERVEVLKGPQSAYFGRAAFSGAVNLVTKDPSQEFEGSASALYGSYNWSDFRVSLEGPIVRDKVALRVTARGYSTDGNYRNAFNGESLGDQSTKSLAATLLITPTDRLRIKLFALGWKDDDGPTSVAKYTVQDYNCNSGVAPAGTVNYLCGVLPSFPDSRVGVNVPINGLIRNVFLNNDRGLFNYLFSPTIDHAGLSRTALHAHLAVSYDLPWFGATLSSLTGVNTEKREGISNSVMEDVSSLVNPGYTGTNLTFPYPTLITYIQNKNKDFSQEFRVTTDQKARLRGLLGVSYLYTNAQQYVVGTSAVAPVVYGPNTPTSTNTFGVFGSLAYDILPPLTLTLEGRYQTDRTKVRSPSGARLDSAEFHAFMPRAMLQYKFSPDNMVYVSAAQATNPGTFNSILFTVPAATLAIVKAATGAGPTVGPEKITNYETGYKGLFWHDRAQLTVAAYMGKWQDQIITDYVTTPLPSNPSVLTIYRPLSNVGQTDLKGVEIEGVVRPIPQLTIQGTYSYSGTKIVKYRCAQCFTQLTGSFNVDGNELPNYPSQQASISGEWRDDLTSNMQYYLRAEYIYHNGLWDSVANLVRTQSMNEINLRAGIDHHDYTLEVFVLNATDDRAATSISPNSDFARLPNLAIMAGLPWKRRFGARLEYRF